MIQGNNDATKNAILDIGRSFNASGASALVCILENQNLFSDLSLKGKEVLEIGCGCLPASFGIPDDQMPKYYLAADTSLELVQQAKKLDSRPVYVVFSALIPAFRDSSFDVVVLRGVLHHLEDPKGAMIIFKKLLKPGGRLLLYEPNLSCLPGNLTKWILLKFFKINMEESPYGQLPRYAILSAIRASGLAMRKEWYSSLLAFQLTGDYGRRPILPDSKKLFRWIVAIDRACSSFLHRMPLLARGLHWRVIFLLEKSQD